MAEKKWVQHISGQGEKWELKEGPYNSGLNTAWQVYPYVRSGEEESYHYLPKSEYLICEPPEQWVDVTEECEVDACNGIAHNGEDTFLDPYRRRKVQLFEQVSEFGDRTSWGRSTAKPRYAFIIEKKVTA